jgi:hypothetical protein
MSSNLDPMAPAEVESEIRRLSRRLSELTEHMMKQAPVAAQAEVDFKLAHAREWLGLRGDDGTVPEKEATALDACASQFEGMKVAEAVWRAQREAAASIRAQLSALQTIAANVRSHITNAHGEGW